MGMHRLYIGNVVWFVINTWILFVTIEVDFDLNWHVEPGSGSII